MRRRSPCQHSRASPSALTPDGRAADPQATAAVGLLRNIPVARFQMVLLPHQNGYFNIFQPQLVHMFETLMATPKPWLYVHALLPGGADEEVAGWVSDATPGSASVGTNATLRLTISQRPSSPVGVRMPIAYCQRFSFRAPCPALLGSETKKTRPDRLPFESLTCWMASLGASSTTTAVRRL